MAISLIVVVILLLLLIYSCWTMFTHCSLFLLLTHWCVFSSHKALHIFISRFSDQSVCEEAGFMFVLLCRKRLVWMCWWWEHTPAPINLILFSFSFLFPTDPHVHLWPRWSIHVLCSFLWAQLPLLTAEKLEKFLVRSSTEYFWSIFPASCCTWAEQEGLEGETRYMLSMLAWLAYLMLLWR